MATTAAPTVAPTVATPAAAPVFTTPHFLAKGAFNTGKTLLKPITVPVKGIFDTSGKITKSVGKSVLNTGKSIVSSTKTYKINKSEQYAKDDFEKAKQKYVDEYLKKNKPQDKIAAKAEAIKNFTTGTTNDPKYTDIKQKYQDAIDAVKNRKDELYREKITNKKANKLDKLESKIGKKLDSVSKSLANKPEELNQKLEQINEKFKQKKENIEKQYDPTKPREKQGFLNRFIDKKLDKYLPSADASRIKEMKKDYYEAFKKGDFSAVTKKYQEKGLEENKDVNDFMNSIFTNDKIDRRKAIEIIKTKMDENGLDADTQQKYIGMMKEFKDDFNIKSFEDKLNGTRPKDKELQDLLINFENIVKKTSSGRPINIADKNLYDNMLSRIDEIQQEIKDDPDRPQDDVSNIKDYVSEIQSKLDIKNEDVMNTTKNIVDFKQVAHYFSILIKFLTSITIIIFVIVLLISFFNLINLSIKILSNIILIFYNTVITNNQTISYEAKNMIKCTKGDYKHDIFNILNEQFTSLSVFNTIVYIIYILLGYVIIFILLLLFVNIYRYTHVLSGELKDIDPKNQLMTILIIIFVSSFVHLLIYKLFFRNLTMNKYKDINNYETNVDIIIRKNLQPVSKGNDEDFFDLLTDSSRRTEIDTILANKVNEIDEATSDLAKYLFMYDIYMYFDEYSNINDIVRDELKNYFKIGDKESTRTFISFLDANERKLIKLYHEDLPFYKQIPKEKLEKFQKINEKISQEIGIINKNIIKYTGTFYPFLFACIYIILIFLFNVLCTYILMDFVISTEKDELFISFIYTIAKKYKNIVLYIYNILKKS